MRVRLGRIVEQVRGVSYKPEDLHDELNENSIILLRANNIKDGLLNFDDVVYVDKKKVSKKQILRSGDILVCASSGSKELVGKAAYIPNDIQATFGAFCKVIRPQMGVQAYIGHYFNSPIYRRQISEASAGANINNIRNEHIDELSLKFPEEQAQYNIVRILDKLSNLIAMRKKQLQKLDDLVKSRFVEMFGGIHDSVQYPYATIDSFATVKSGGTPDRDTPEYWENGTIRWVKTTELQNCIIEDTEEKITELAMNNSSAKLIPANSILIAMYGQGKTRGMTGYLAVESTTNQACACILPSNSVNQKYLWCYMMLSYDKLRDMAKGGNQPNLNAGIIKAFPVLMPPMQLQEQFATFVEQTDKSKLTIQQSLDKLELMKKALMQKYFS